jgi:hypothetical protein
MRKQNPAKREGARRLTRPAARCLAALLDAELNGAPVEAIVWRARNARKIPLIEELTRNRMVEGQSHYVLTFWGLMNAPGERAIVALSACERVFRALRRYFPMHPKSPLLLVDLAKRSRLSADQALQSAHFLSRSPAYLSIHSEDQITRVAPNEHYVTYKGFTDVKDKAREQAALAVKALYSRIQGAIAIDGGLTSNLENSESDIVRQCWLKAVERVTKDPEGAITAARSLVEAGCKHVLDELGESSEPKLELPRLFKAATGLLKLDPTANIDESLRRALQGCASIVDGLAHLRNQLGDAHGRSQRAARPARRHAEFVVMIAGAMTGFLLATLDSQRKP